MDHKIEAAVKAPADRRGGACAPRVSRAGGNAARTRGMVHEAAASAAGPFFTRGESPCPARRGRCSRIVKRVVRSTSEPIAEPPRPRMTSPSQCPGTARSAASAGRWLFMISGVTKPLGRDHAAQLLRKLDPRRTVVSARSHRTTGEYSCAFGCAALPTQPRHGGFLINSCRNRYSWRVDARLRFAKSPRDGRSKRLAP